MKQRDRRHRCWTHEGAARRFERRMLVLVNEGVSRLALEIERDVFANVFRSMEFPAIVCVAPPRKFTVQGRD